MNDRPITKWPVRIALAAGVFLLLGAGLPTKGLPSLSTDTLTGEVTGATRSDVDDLKGPKCPLFYPFSEESGVRGDREIWTGRIAGKDPDARLHIAPCLGYTGKAWQVVNSSPFTIETVWGRVTGTATGTLDYDTYGDAGQRPFFSLALNITGGTGAYRRATGGDLHYIGCLGPEWNGDEIYGAAIVESTDASWTQPPTCAGR